MTTYPLADGQTLVLSVNDARWQTVTFDAADFKDVGAARPAEVAKVLKGLDHLQVSAEGPRVVLTTVAKGRTASIEIDTPRSSAAAAFGLIEGPLRVTGTGPTAARLVSANAEPFALPARSEMTIVVDGDRKRVVLADVTIGQATADEVVNAINAAKANLASVSRDGRIVLLSPSTGSDSTLRVDPPRAARGGPDASATIGFFDDATGEDDGRPARAELSLEGPGQDLRVVNLTATPIQFHLVTRTVVLPALGSAVLAPAEAAHRPLQRLLADGSLRLAGARDQ